MAKVEVGYHKYNRVQGDLSLNKNSQKKTPKVLPMERNRVYKHNLKNLQSAEVNTYGQSKKKYKFIFIKKSDKYDT